MITKYVYRNPFGGRAGMHRLGLFATVLLIGFGYPVLGLIALLVAWAEADLR